MGQPVRIVDLARQMIRLAGLRVAEGERRAPGAIRIAFTGLRPGEKLFEELFHGKEPPVPTGASRAADGHAAHGRPGDRGAGDGRVRRGVPRRPAGGGADAAGADGAGVRARRRAGAGGDPWRMSVSRPIPFLDLKAQQARIAERLRPRLEAVLAHCQFILGPEVAELEGGWRRIAAPRIASA